MKAVLLSVHVVAAIVLIGPITVAASVFPRYARLALTPSPTQGGRRDRSMGGGVGDAPDQPRLRRACVGGASFRHRRRFSARGADPAVGPRVDGADVAVAGALLAVAIVPGQRQVLGAGAGGAGVSAGSTAHPTGQLRRLAMSTGAFALLWVVVVALMILRPGSTTGV
jgi:hypothetical protein